MCSCATCIENENPAKGIVLGSVISIVLWGIAFAALVHWSPTLVHFAIAGLR
jgi:hypothetical protein